MEAIKTYKQNRTVAYGSILIKGFEMLCYILNVTYPEYFIDLMLNI
jgi:hypothetical protein